MQHTFNHTVRKCIAVGLSWLMTLLTTTAVYGQAGDSASSSTDTTFISFNGKFYIHFPSRWKKVDYTTVDYYQQKGGNPLDYEAVFAPPDATPFFQSDYLVIQADTLGPLSAKSIDSLLKAIENDIHSPIRRIPSVTNLATELAVGTAFFDQSNQVFWNLNELVDRENVKKRSLIAEKYYERGIARFMFFAPESTYAALLPQFTQVVASFGSENYETKIPKAEVVVADTSAFKKEETGGVKTIYIIIAIAVAIGTPIIVANMKKKS